MPDVSPAGPPTLWTNSVCLGSSLLGGIIGNLAASLAWEGTKWVAKPLLDKIPEITELLSSGGYGQNHDLLRALRRAECAAMAEIIDVCIIAHSGIEINTRSIREFLRARVQSRDDATLDTLCRLRRTFRRVFAELKDMSAKDLVRLNGGALQDVPGLVQAGAECFSSDDQAELRGKVVNDFVAALTTAVTGPARFAALDDTDLAPVAPLGLPQILLDHMRQHPKGWWDYLRIAFREELKNPDNGLARTAWELDVQSSLASVLGGSYPEMASPLDRVDEALDRQWVMLQSFREDFDRFADEVLGLLRGIDQGIDILRSDMVTAHDKLDDLARRLDRGDPEARGSAWHQLPAIPEYFEGRSATVEAIAADVRRAYSRGEREGLIRVIEGAGGLGKSALAAAIGHALRDDFPEMQLVLRLRTHSGQPFSAEQARNTLLQQIYPALDLPDNEASCWTTYQSLFVQADGTPKRGLLVIDDCANEAQLRALLPSAPCPVVVTTRRAFALGQTELITRLDPPSAERLLIAIFADLGADRLAAELARLCGGFPVALRAAAGFLRRSKRKGPAIRAYLEELRADPLSRLQCEDPESNTRLVLQHSLRDLGPTEFQALHALTVFTSDFDRAAAGAVADCAERTLDLLAELHLIEVHTNDDRFAWHDLLRALVCDHPNGAERVSAYTRFVEHFTILARNASIPYWGGPGSFTESQLVVDRELVHIEAAMRWLLCAQTPTLQCALVEALHPRLIVHRLSWKVMGEWYQGGRQAAQGLCDIGCQAAALFSLGLIAYYQGDNDTACGHYEAALAIHRATGNRSGEADALYGLGDVARMQDDNDTACGHLTGEWRKGGGGGGGGGRGGAGYLSRHRQPHGRSQRAVRAGRCGPHAGRL